MLAMKENSFFHSDLKVVLVAVLPAISERFTSFLIGLIDLDDSAILILMILFQKICICLKMLFQKILLA